jgi:hypothetical protein
MHSSLALALGSAVLMSVGLIAWRLVRHLWPQTGIVR